MSSMHCRDLRNTLCARCKSGSELTGLQAKFGEVLVPSEEVVEMKAGKKRRSERKFFPATC